MLYTRIYFSSLYLWMHVALCSCCLAQWSRLLAGASAILNHDLLDFALGMGSMPNLSMPTSMSTITPLAPMSLTSMTSIPPLVISAPLVPSVSTSSLPNGTSSLLQPLSIPFSSSKYSTVQYSLSELQILLYG